MKRLSIAIMAGMFAKFINFLAGDQNKRTLSKIRPIVEHINSLEPRIEALSDDELKAKTQEFKEIIQERLAEVELTTLIPDDVAKMPGQIRTSHDKVIGEILEEILPEAFAVCREAARRVLHMRHFDVQLIGGIQIHRNGIAEMQTGEGKTLVCTLPAYLNALSGKGVHVATVNDYLAKRDAEWMGKVYKFLGLSVGIVDHDMPHDDRKAAYNCDITYGTNNEFGFDYLRDNMESSLDNCVQRDYFMCIVDEVDSILIDEARTPLIISGLPDRSKSDIYLVMNKVAKQLKRGEDEKDTKLDYYVDEKAKNVILTDAGIHKAEGILKVKDLWAHEANLSHHLLNALKAKELFIRDTDYIVKTSEETKKKEIVIVDEFTGRLMEGRRWSDGLHQAVEAKEGVKIQEESLTMASITFQNLFRLYPKLAGMTGTAATEAEEFSKIYNLNVLQIPTNKPNVRKDANDIVYKTEEIKYISIVEDIVETHATGRPVLVGTTSIERSELIADMLSKPAKMMQVMQFRAKRLLALLEKHNIENVELKKALDRPGNITTDSIKAHLDAILEQNNDETLTFAVESLGKTINVLDAIRNKIKFNVLNAKHHEKEAQIIRQAGKAGAITIATNMAGRGTDIVLGAYLSNDPKDSAYEVADLDEQKRIKGLGGLHVIGTERHESRRIDNQLRGRCARQGDPGTTKFYLSLEDNLMRIFGGDKIIGIMNVLKAEEDLPIEAGMVSGAINNAQKKVEAYHFDMRKHVLQYDDVLNTQREVIYRERRQILEGENIHHSVVEMIDEHLDNIIYGQIDPNTPTDLWYDESQGPSAMSNIYKTIKADFGDAVHAELPDVNDFLQTGFDPLMHRCKEAAHKIYKEKETEFTEEAIRAAERQIMLHMIDSKWIEHLHSMDRLKEGIHLRGYGQKDPLIEYKREGFDMFEALLETIRKDTVVLLYHAQIVRAENPQNGQNNKEGSKSLV